MTQSKNAIPVAVVVGVLALALGGLGGWWMRGSATTVGSNDGAANGSQDMDELRERIEQLEHRGAGVPATGSRSPAAAQAEAEARRMTPQMQEAARRADTEKFGKALEAAFAGQGAAPARDPVPDRVEAAFADAGVLEAADLPQSEDVSCRATLCLVRARFAPGADTGDWMNRMLLTVGDVLPSASATTVTLPDGSSELRVYLGRQGERAPVEWARPKQTR
jgi:hypothetical protein